MATKPNMRMGGVDTQGDRGVMAGAMQAAQIKANAQDDSGMNSLASNVMNWASDVQKEERQVRLEERASKRGIAKEGRADAKADALYDKGAPKREADLALTEAKTTKALEESAYIKGGKTAGTKAGKMSDIDKKVYDRNNDITKDPTRTPTERNNARKVMAKLEGKYGDTPTKAPVSAADRLAAAEAAKAEATGEVGAVQRTATMAPKQGPSPADKARITQKYGTQRPLSEQEINEIYQAEMLEQAGVGKPTLSPQLLNRGGVLSGSKLQAPTRL